MNSLQNSVLCLQQNISLFAKTTSLLTNLATMGHIVVQAAAKNPSAACFPSSNTGFCLRSTRGFEHGDSQPSCSPRYRANPQSATREQTLYPWQLRIHKPLIEKIEEFTIKLLQSLVHSGEHQPEQSSTPSNKGHILLPNRDSPLRSDQN